MILFFKKKQTENKDKITLVCSLLVHAAKIDENYTEKEKKIILSALAQLYNKNEDELIKVLAHAEKLENQSNYLINLSKFFCPHNKVEHFSEREYQTRTCRWSVCEFCNKKL